MFEKGISEETFKNISKIIERDSKVATYKFALLRGLIDIILENSPFIRLKENFAEIPLGLLIEKWLIYYYPLLNAEKKIPQINGSNKLAFEEQMLGLIAYYEKKGSISKFYNDLIKDGIADEILDCFTALVKNMRNTITDKPMRHIGFSIYKEHYAIFNFDCPSISRGIKMRDIGDLIANLGTFNIPVEYYRAFRVLGSFISGQDSIIFRWAEFSKKLSRQNLELHEILNEVLKSPITERDSTTSKNQYEEVLKTLGFVNCVWTNRKINAFHVDHVIPFSVWKNNDLWNLMPSDPKTNNSKIDKIPSPKLINERKDLIIEYWELIRNKFPVRFDKEIRIALIGSSDMANWQSKAIDQLKNNCEYLISTRGYEEWKYA